MLSTLRHAPFCSFVSSSGLNMPPACTCDKEEELLGNNAETKPRVLIFLPVTSRAPLAMGTNLSFTLYLRISTFILCFLPSANAAIHRVTHNDSRISYIPSTCDLDCTRVCRDQWWLSCLSDGSASHRTEGNNTSSNFSFMGSSVTWYTRTANDGGKADVYIDAIFAQTIDTNSPVVNEANPVFTKSGLDPTQTHTISVLYNLASYTESIERFVDVRYFDYDDGEDDVSSSPMTQSQSPVTPSALLSTATTSSTTTTGSSATHNVNMTSTTTSTTSSLTSLSPVMVTFSNGTAQTVAFVDGSIESANHASTSLATGTVAGIALGSAAIICIFALCFFFGKRQQRRADIRSDCSAKRSETMHLSPSGSQSRPVSLVSLSRHGAEPSTSTETFFHNIRTSQFYTLRNPRPALSFDASTSKRHLHPQYSNPNFSEPHHENLEPLSSPFMQSRSSPPSEVSLDEAPLPPRTNPALASLNSGTRMTSMMQESPSGVYAPSISQGTQSRRDNRSSRGTWLPSTPPPQYIG